jgi:DNA-binding NarL/FixJ family response regulator
LSIRLVLADDHPIVLQGLQHLFARHADFDVVACCADAPAALAAVRSHRPDVALIDLRMPGTSERVSGGLELLTALAEWPACRRIVLTAAITPDEVVAVLRSGASGLILKESPADKLLECVRSVYAGEQWLDAETVTRPVRDAIDRRAVRGELSQTLTAREMEIVRMVADGLRNRAIGDRLNISELTVKVHLRHIFKKLDVEGRVELVRWAHRCGLL